MESVAHLREGEFLGVEGLFGGILRALSVEHHVANVGRSVVSLMDGGGFGLF